MRAGDVVMTTSIEVRNAVTKPGMRANFKSKPGTAMVFIACGGVAHGYDEYEQARRVLEAMGWSQKPEEEGRDEGIERAFAATKGGVA